MQIKSCLKTQGLLNVIHYTVYLFISNIGTGSPGGRQRQAERPKSRRVNYRQNELFQPPPLPPPAQARLPHPGRSRPPFRPPAASLARLAVPLSPGWPLSLFSLSFSFFFCPLTSLCFTFFSLGLVFSLRPLLAESALFLALCLSLLAFSSMIAISSHSHDGHLGLC